MHSFFDVVVLSLDSTCEYSLVVCFCVAWAYLKPRYKLVSMDATCGLFVLFVLSDFDLGILI